MLCLIRTEGKRGDTITIGKDNTNDDWTYAVIQYEIYDGRIRHGSTCTDYSRLQTSYNDCFLEALQLYLIEKIGCILPFASLQTKERSEFFCKEHENVFDHDIFKIQMKLGNWFVNEIDAGYLQQCLPPCTTYKVKIIETEKYTNIYEGATLSYFFEEYIDVYTEMYSYDMFSLVVDLGSALGLWLGLSALCILDDLFMVWNAIVEWNRK